MYETNETHQRWLEETITALDGVAGTVHVLNGTGLRLSAAYRIPPPVIATVADLPRGKGMAGIAQTSGKSVQTCDLQTDSSGNIKLGARAVDAQAAIAVPLSDADGEVVAVVGIAWATAGVVTPEVEQAIRRRAEALVPLSSAP